MSQVVQIPLSDWKRIERILINLDKDAKKAARAEWITAAAFTAKTGQTKEQLRGFRDRHPELVKPKPGVDTVARYLYNWTGYCAIYNN